jgi:DNA-binding transcriptional LysR family regulator
VQLANVDLNLLVLFSVVLGEKNVGRAAKRLSLSASAVSHGLGRLRKLFEDPLFLRTPKGVVPTARANELAPAVTEILARVEMVLAASTPFEPHTSTRRFVLGMSDATAVVQLPSLLAHVRQRAPLIDISVRQILPMDALPQLEARTVDLVVAAVDDVPARFHAAPLYDESFVIAARRQHPFLRAPSLERYCQAEHVLVSVVGDAHGFFDQALHSRGLTRRVALTVPSFMLALASLAQTDLLVALPLSLAQAEAARFGAAWVPAPLPIRSYTLKAITTRAALQDPGVAWIFDALVSVSVPGVPLAKAPSARKPPPRRRVPRRG